LTGISESGLMTGVYDYYDGPDCDNLGSAAYRTAGFMYDGSTFQNISESDSAWIYSGLFVPTDINNSGQVIGIVKDNPQAGEYFTRSFLYSPQCQDRDGDGYGKPHYGCEFLINDCDDEDDTINPGAEENCHNTTDDNCNDLTDRDDPDCDNACYDVDGDGYGNPASSECSHPELDCNDSDPDVHPRVREDCYNGIDDNCNDLIDGEDSECVCGTMPLSAIKTAPGLLMNLLSYLIPFLFVLNLKRKNH